MRRWLPIGCLLMLSATPARGQPCPQPPCNQPPPGSDGREAVDEMAESPHDYADAIVVFVPSHGTDLAVAHEREIHGQITRIDKMKPGKGRPAVIVQRAHVLMSSLEAHRPVRLFLKEDPERPGTYQIIYRSSLGKGEN